MGIRILMHQPTIPPPTTLLTAVSTIASFSSDNTRRKFKNMDHQNLQTLSQFSRYQFLKKITQFLLSVSVFSLILFFSFSTVPVQLFSHSLDKNCIFLLCNGLLVFVAKFSGLISSSSVYNNHSSIESVKSYEDDAQPVLDQYSKVSLLVKEDLMAQENIVAGEERRESDECITREVEERETKQFIVEDEPDQERESGFSITPGNKEVSEVLVEEDDDHQEETIGEFVDKFPIQEDEEEYEYEEENGTLSTEELNKKFEEFIRKMKEEIRIEAQQQLVMVN